MATKQLLLETSKKMNSALALKKFKTAYSLLQISNSLRIELGQDILTLPNLEAKSN